MQIVKAAAALPLALGFATAALRPLPPDFHPVDGRAAAVYKTTPQGDLKTNLYFPPGWTAADRRPGIVLFFGGSCATGSPAQFASTAEYFADRGLVAVAPEYRIESIHHTSPERCIEDGKSAIRWLRMNGARLGIDVRRVVAGGGSSGASIAAFSAYNQEFEAGDEDRSISPQPDALVLLNPAFGCPPGQAAPGAPCTLMTRWKASKGGPPAILVYGSEDPLQEGGLEFVRQSIGAGIRTELYTAAGQSHGFFNRFPDSPWHALVLRQMDLFLASLGYLKGEPKVRVPADTAVSLRRENL